MFEVLPKYFNSLTMLSKFNCVKLVSVVLTRLFDMKKNLSKIP